MLTQAALGFAPFLLQRVASLFAAARFRRRCLAASRHHGDWPAVTILKPLCGAEPGLDAAIETFLALDYPSLQFVFGLHDKSDPAVLVIEAAAKRHAALDIVLVIDDVLPCVNRKIANLLNMLPRARHDILLIADSDMYVPTDYLRRVISELQVPDTGLVTTPYAGTAMNGSVAARLGASQINGSFLPGTILGAMLGRQDCLGATMALRRATLDRLGGLAALGDHVADDAQLGRAVRRMGLRVAAAPTIPVTAVTETTLASLMSHELRWGVTIRALAPLSFAASIVQYPVPFAGAAMIVSNPHAAGLATFLGFWAWQYWSTIIIARLLGVREPHTGFLIPLRETLSVGILVASYFCTRVTWRGHQFTMSRQRPLLLIPRLRRLTTR